MGDVHVFVPEDELDAASELLLADDIESAFDGAGSGDDDAGHVWQLWVVVAAILVAASRSLARAV
jgi:hypothetical protein